MFNYGWSPKIISQGIAKYKQESKVRESPKSVRQKLRSLLVERATKYFKNIVRFSYDRRLMDRIFARKTKLIREASFIPVIDSFQVFSSISLSVTDRHTDKNEALSNY